MVNDVYTSSLYLLYREFCFKAGFQLNLDRHVAEEIRDFQIYEIFLCMYQYTHFILLKCIDSTAEMSTHHKSCKGLTSIGVVIKGLCESFYYYYLYICIFNDSYENDF